MSDLKDTREYRALKESYDNDPEFIPYLKDCLEGIEEALRNPDDPPLDIDILCKILCSIFN